MLDEFIVNVFRSITSSFLFLLNSSLIRFELVFFILVRGTFESQYVALVIFRCLNFLFSVNGLTRPFDIQFDAYKVILLQLTARGVLLLDTEYGLYFVELFCFPNIFLLISNTSEGFSSRGIRLISALIFLLKNERILDHFFVSLFGLVNTMLLAIKVVNF